jgi:photosynthetic reaction center cytochrome c subunit
MKLGLTIAAALSGLAVAAVAFTTFTVPPLAAIQNGWRGTGMVQIDTKRNEAARKAANAVPEAQPTADKANEKSSAAYKNVKVLGDVDSAEFLRLMTAITEWVSPEQGCTYCHKEGAELDDDSLYTKVVARRMLQMTMAINAGWKSHVAETGVTCYTCHRGQPVPENVWSLQTAANTPPYAGNKDKQNYPSGHVGAASLPNDIYAPYLSKAAEIRVGGKSALPTGPNASIQATEQTYGLMMHMSQGLGVNCTFCHNTQNFGEWSTSTPQRVTAWHGIRMMREINNTYIDTLANVFPANRKGPAGDVLKANCATCHAGVSKPLYGVSMVKDYLELKAAPPR